MINISELLQSSNGCNAVADATKWHPEVRNIIIELLRKELKKRLIDRMSEVPGDVNINDMINQGTAPSVATISTYINTLLSTFEK